MDHRFRLGPWHTISTRLLVMPLKFYCVCGQAMVVSRRLVGKGVRCPSCDVKVKVPAPAAFTPHSPVATEGPPVPFDPHRRSLAAEPGQSPDQVAEEVAGASSAGDVVRGYEPHPRDVSASRSLALGLAAVALCGLVPAILDIGAHFRTENSPGVAVWAILALWFALLQLSYAIYLGQLPDWSSLWVATLVTMLISVGYAMLLALTSLSRPESWLARVLDLSDQLAGGRAAGWCFIMLCLTGLVSYLSGRLSVRWQQGLGA